MEFKIASTRFRFLSASLWFFACIACTTGRGGIPVLCAVALHEGGMCWRSKR
jgi:hypothetical protein